MENRQSVPDAAIPGSGKARLTFLLDVTLKEEFEAMCASQQRNCSQAVRQLIGEYLEMRVKQAPAPAKRRA